MNGQGGAPVTGRCSSHNPGCQRRRITDDRDAVYNSHAGDQQIRQRRTETKDRPQCCRYDHHVGYNLFATENAGNFVAADAVTGRVKGNGPGLERSFGVR